MGLLETAAATLVGGERRIETAARNITNANTAGYKREVAFTQLLDSSGDARSVTSSAPETASAMMLGQAVLIETGEPLDLAINGAGMMLLRDGSNFVLSRGGKFAPGIDGTLVDAVGRIVQQAGGGDLELTTTTPTILTDGTVLDGDMPVAAIGVFTADGLDPAASLDPDQVRALATDDESELRQGMTENSNVTLSDEMVELMRTQRQVESGAQLVRAYDQLMSQAISTFSRSGS